MGSLLNKKLDVKQVAADIDDDVDELDDFLLSKES